MQTEPADPPEIVSTRVLDTTPDGLFDALCDPEQLAAWWGPHGFTNHFHAFEPRAGGRWRYDMRGPDGAVFPQERTFSEVVPGRVVMRNEHPRHEFTMTLTWAPLDGRVLLQWSMLFDSQDEAGRVRAANEENFDRLAAHLRGRR
ncbi:MAG: SRPBCC domain-containing protein [Dehalococcoidia bacterium]|nr:SRPBCC domain-containing protein [Dehalococcoidia bacterium]